MYANSNGHYSNAALYIDGVQVEVITAGQFNNYTGTPQSVYGKVHKV